MRIFNKRQVIRFYKLSSKFNLFQFRRFNFNSTFIFAFQVLFRGNVHIPSHINNIILNEYSVIYSSLLKIFPQDFD